MKRKDYLSKLDAFLLNLAADSQQGLVLGFDDRHGEHLNWLLRHRADLDHDAPRKVPVGVVDALESVEKGVSDLRSALRNGH
jgi:hypothetical protein